VPGAHAISCSPVVDASEPHDGVLEGNNLLATYQLLPQQPPARRAGAVIVHVCEVTEVLVLHVDGDHDLGWRIAEAGHDVHRQVVDIATWSTTDRMVRV